MHSGVASSLSLHLSTALHSRQRKVVGGLHNTSHNARGAPHGGASNVGGSLDALRGLLHSSGAGKGRQCRWVGQLSWSERMLPTAAAEAAALVQEACSARPALTRRLLHCHSPVSPG
jgi:hypothetical protein